MGVQDGSQLLRPSKGSTHTLRNVRSAMRQSYPLDGDSHPLVLIDTSIFIVPALRRKEALSQFFIIPPVPVTAVANAVGATCKQLVNHKFRPCLVFDGASYPPKKDTSQKRYKNLPDEVRRLEMLYQQQQDAGKDITQETIFKQQKNAVSVRPDVLYEVLKMARENNYDIIGAPFEADSQIVSLLNQGVGEFALTNDSDIPYQGASQTIMKLSQQGRCSLVTRAVVLESFKKRFNSARDIGVRDLAIFSAMCGTDYVPRVQGHGLAYAEASMKQYVTLSTETEQKEFIKAHVKKLPVQEQSKFQVSLYSWEYAPAFYIVPTAESDTPRAAFNKGADHFEVCLRPMNNCDVNLSSWEDGLGFPVDGTLRTGHDASANPPSLLEMFLMQSWSRTGVPLPSVPPLTNRDGDELLPYSIIDFAARPARLLDPIILRTYLLARGVNVQFGSHQAMVSTVEEVSKEPTTPLPRFMFRGNGGYRTYEVLFPRNGDLVWRRGNQMLQKIRTVLPTLSNDWFTANFGVRNSSRYRCLKHLKGVSYNINDLVFTDGLVSRIEPEQEVVVFRASCTPSQKLGGGDLYTLTCVFRRRPNSNIYDYVDHPISTCSCYNGHTFDAHKGGLLLLMYMIQQRPTWSFERCESMLPEAIHLVVATTMFTSYVFPRRTSKEARRQMQVRKQTVKAARIHVAEVEDSSESDDSSGRNSGRTSNGSPARGSDDDSLDSGSYVSSDESEASNEGSSDESASSEDSDRRELLRWANPLAANPVRDVGSAPPLPICNIVSQWIHHLEATERDTGDPRRLASKLLQEAGVEMATARTDDYYLKEQLTRLIRILEMTEEDPENCRCLLSYYIFLNYEKIVEALNAIEEEIDVTFVPHSIYERQQ